MKLHVYRRRAPIAPFCFTLASMQQAASTGLRRAERATDFVQSGLDLAETVLRVASAVPVFGGVCAAAKEVLADVRSCAEKVEDIVEAGRRVLDTLKLLEVMARNLSRLGEAERAELESLMAELRAMLIDMQGVVRSFGQRGWLRKTIQLRQHAKTLKKLDRKIRDTMENGLRLYRFAQDAAMAETQEQLKVLLLDGKYMLEDSVEAKVQERIAAAATAGTTKSVDEAAIEVTGDARALSDVAHQAGISREEMRAELSEFTEEVRLQYEQMQASIDK
eukprot:1305188-Prymnesium_polylepis.1